MSTAATSTYKLVKQIKSESFNLDKLSAYTLCMLVGVRDFQFVVINQQTNSCLYLEDYKLENIKTINTRLEAIQEICTNHEALSQQNWNHIKLCFKSHKFSLIPNSHFLPEASSDYLAVNAEIKTKIEEVYYYKHISGNAVNVFAGDKKIIHWSKNAFPSKNIQILHQGSALIEGILKYDDHTHEKMMFSYADRGILHLAVTEKQQLLYYNQFAVRKSEDYLKYIMLVFKELGLSPKTSKMLMWGALKVNAPQIQLLKKYIRNISLGGQPNFIKLSDSFQEIPDHRYFDLFSIFLCE